MIEGQRDHRCGIVLRVARVHDEGQPEPPGQVDLEGEDLALPFSRRIVIMIIETALPDGDRAGREQRFER